MLAGAERRSASYRAAFRLLLGLGFCGLTASATAMIAVATSVTRRPAEAHHAVLAGVRLSYPAVNAAGAVLLAMAAVGAAAVGLAIRATARHARDHRRLLRSLRVVDRLPVSPSAEVIAGGRPQAFCAGYLRPRIYVSRGAVQLLSGPELRAVLLHEEHHRRRHDPLRLACGHVLSRALFFLPALAPLRDLHSLGAELEADEAAVVGSGGGRGALASALLAFDSSAPAGGAGISPARVDSLLGRAPRARVPAPLVLLALITLAGLVVALWRASGAASARATFDLPLVSSQPCVLVLGLVPVALVAGGVLIRARSR